MVAPLEEEAQEVEVAVEEGGLPLTMVGAPVTGTPH